MLTRNILLVALASLATASPPDVTFLCDKIPDICTNMCWAVRCANPVFTQDLTWDDPSATVRKDRRKSAGCQKGNKCNAGKSGVGHRGSPYVSCDEYPFATASQSDAGKQVSRCVTNDEQDSQGGTLSAAYKRFKKDGGPPHSMRVGFGNPGSSGVNYCDNQACTNDGYEVQDGQWSKRDSPEFTFYNTRSGMIIALIADADPGNFTREVGLGEIPGPDFDVWREIIDGVEMEFLTDTLLYPIA